MGRGLETKEWIRTEGSEAVGRSRTAGTIQNNVEVRQSNDSAEADAQQSNCRQSKTFPGKEPRLPSIPGENPCGDVAGKEQRAKVEIERVDHAEQRHRNGEKNPASSPQSLFGAQENGGEGQEFLRREIPAASHRHVGRESEQERAEQCSSSRHPAKFEEPKEEQPGDDDLKQMLNDESLSDESRG